MVKIELPFPPSVNAAYANGGTRRGRHKTAALKSWEVLASTMVKASHRQMLGPYSIQICFKRPDKRIRDLGNYEKVVSDFLVMHGVVKDDSYCERMTLAWDAGLKTGCVVIVQPSEEALAA